MSLDEFNEDSKRNYDYMLDPVFGAFNYVLKDPNYYYDRSNDKNILYGRDCDDTAQVWHLYLSSKYKEVYQIWICPGYNFLRSHVFNVFKDPETNKYVLVNTTIYSKRFDSIEDIINEFATQELVLGGRYINPTWGIWAKNS